jgi:hypothetical protein
MAARTASQWDNSYKSYSTGAYFVDQQDGLYWRLFDDSITDVFQFLIPAKRSEVIIDKESMSLERAESLPEKKLIQSAEQLPSGVIAKLSYRNYLLKRSVTVRLESKLHLPSFIHPFLGDGMYTAETTATITEPDEFIRTLDFARTYLPYAQHYLNRSKLGTILSRFRKQQTTPAETANMSFRTHNEAKQFLQNAVNGKETSISTEQTGKRRIIDALDAQGIAHQAYIGAQSNSKDIKDQWNKDLELMRAGKIKGVVWHFFQKDGVTASGPSKSLRKDLEVSGIVIILH